MCFIKAFINHLFYVLQQVPNLQAHGQVPVRPIRNRATQQEVSLNVMYFNHPETMLPTAVHGKIVFHKSSLWCQKHLGPLLYGSIFNQCAARIFKTGNT